MVVNPVVGSFCNLEKLSDEAFQGLVLIGAPMYAGLKLPALGADETQVKTANIWVSPHCL